MLRLTTFAQSLQHLLKLDLCKIRVLLDSSGSIILAHIQFLKYRAYYEIGRFSILYIP
jgi:hypothetical protein